jgi:hypothetical protein
MGIFNNQKPNNLVECVQKNELVLQYSISGELLIYTFDATLHRRFNHIET